MNKNCPTFSILDKFLGVECMLKKLLVPLLILVLVLGPNAGFSETESMDSESSEEESGGKRRFAQLEAGVCG